MKGKLAKRVCIPQSKRTKNSQQQSLVKRKKGLIKGKEKGRLSILSGWHKEDKEEPWDQRVFPSTSYSLSLGIFSSLPSPE